jgi:hypothetical protein
VHSKSRRSYVSLRGPDAQASYMKIECIRSTVRTLRQHRPNAAQFRKEFQRDWYYRVMETNQDCIEEQEVVILEIRKGIQMMEAGSCVRKAKI